jgi:hypothetical protein
MHAETDQHKDRGGGRGYCNDGEGYPDVKRTQPDQVRVAEASIQLLQREQKESASQNARHVAQVPAEGGRGGGSVRGGGRVLS